MRWFLQSAKEEDSDVILNRMNRLHQLNQLNPKHLLIMQTKPTNQLRNQPTNCATNQLRNQPTAQPSNHPANQPTNQPANQPTKPSGMFAMLAVLQWLDRLATAQCCLSSSLMVKHTSPTNPTNQKMVACEYQLSGKPLGHIVMEDHEDQEDQEDQVDLVDQAGLRTASVLAKVSAMLEKLKVDHPARLLLVDQFTVMIGHAGPNMLDVCASELSRAELLVIGPYRLPDHLAEIGAFVRLYVGTLVRWYVGTLVRLYVGTLVRLYVGTLVRLYVGTLLVRLCIS